MLSNNIIKIKLKLQIINFKKFNKNIINKIQIEVIVTDHSIK
jgi:hypothetical protein